MKRPASGSDGPGVLQDLLVDRVVGDVLAEALLAGAAQVDDRALALELARDAGLQGLERVVVDLQLERRRAAPRCSCARPAPSRRLTSSSRRSSSSASPTALSSRAQCSISVLPSPSSCERLVEARLPGVEAPDDLLDARAGGLVAEAGGGVLLLAGRRLRGCLPVLVVGGSPSARCRSAALIARAPSHRRSRRRSAAAARRRASARRRA